MQARVGGALKMLPRPVDVHAVVGESIGQLAVAFPQGRIVRHIARAHGGLIEVASSERDGTALTLAFPAEALSG